MAQPNSGPARRCPSCGSRLGAGARECAICGQALPWHWTRRGVLVESAVVVAAVAVLALGLLWVRRSGGPLMRPEERVARLDVVDRPPTDMPTFTPEPTATATPAGAAQEEEGASSEPTTATTTHIVAAGESLFAIAARYDVAPEAVVEANGLDRPEALSVGQELTIPVVPPSSAADASDGPVEEPTEAPVEAVADAGAAGEPTDAGASDDATQVPAPEGQAGSAEDEMVTVSEAEVYVVKSGDTLGGIAARYGLSLDALLEMNAAWLESVDQMLQVGDEVTVRAAEVAAASPETPLLGTVAAGAESAAVSVLGAVPGEIEAVVYEAAQGARFEAPGVLAPGEGAVVTEDTVLLRWTSAGLLPRLVGYVVALRAPDAPEEAATLIWVPGNATALRVPSEFRPALGASADLAWSVSVRRRGGRVVDRSGTLLSPAPTWSTFRWVPGG